MEKLLFFGLISILLLGCTGGGMVVEKGDKVSVMYLGTLENGEVFDTNIIEEAKTAGIYQSARPYTALEFEVGAGQMIKGFDEGVIGMKEGETKTITIPPEQAYGQPQQDLIRKVPIEDLTKTGVAPEVGQVLSTSTGAMGTIKEVTDTEVTIDFNHFLAGKTLQFKITMEKIEKKGTN